MFRAQSLDKNCREMERNKMIGHSCMNMHARKLSSGMLELNLNNFSAGDAATMYIKIVMSQSSRLFWVIQASVFNIMYICILSTSQENVHWPSFNEQGIRQFL